MATGRLSQPEIDGRGAELYGDFYTPVLVMWKYPKLDRPIVSCCSAIMGQSLLVVTTKDVTLHNLKLFHLPSI